MGHSAVPGTPGREVRDITYALDQSAIVARTDQRGIINYVNDKFCEISKYSREELLGQDHRIINSGYHPKEFIKELWKTIAGGRVWRGEIRNRAKDGSIYWVDTTIVPFLNSHGKPYQYLSIRADITDRKRAEEALRRTEAELREKETLARLGEMAAVVAHEVRNPLAGIGGALQVIRERMPESNSDREVIGEILTRLDGLHVLVRDLLVFARPRAPRPEPLPLQPLLDATARELTRDRAFQGLRVEVAEVGPAPRVSGDAELLRSALSNLALNAAQAAGRSGTVAIGATAEDGFATITIRDTGPGIAEEIREKVFEPFFTTKHRGTGLGLAVVKRIVESHGGEIRLTCPPSGGTVACVRLPLAAG